MITLTLNKNLLALLNLTLIIEFLFIMITPMKKFSIIYKKTISIVFLGAYLLILGYSSFHLHKTNYFLEDAINVEGKVFSNSSFHQNGFCLLFHFNCSQLKGDIDSITDYKPTEILVKQSAFTSSLISSEINSLLRRGPPSII